MRRDRIMTRFKGAACLPILRTAQNSADREIKDLEALTGNVEETLMAAVLEFDFVPQSTPLNIQLCVCVRGISMLCMFPI